MSEKLQPLPLGVSDFQKLRETGKIYVDKTEFIYKLATTYEKVFIARPRRFGKSLLVSTFESLFKYGLRDFEGLAIEKLWRDKTYNVVRLDFSEAKNFENFEDFALQFKSVLLSAFKPYGFNFVPNTVETLCSQLSAWLKSVPTNSLVLLIDEYDAPLTACLNDIELFKNVRKELSSFYATIKSNDGAVRFFFMTGITKFNKTSIFSELNTFTDISLDTEFGTLLGYTEEEIKQYFAGYLENTKNVLGISCENILTELRKNYDGFCFDEETATHVYAPWSVLNLLSRPRKGFQNYWFESGGRPSALLQYLKSHALRNPDEYGKPQSIALSTLANSADVDSLSDVGLLTQAGYLTLKKVEYDVAFLGYPNLEVKKSIAQLYTEQLLGGFLPGQLGIGGIISVLLKETPEDLLHILNKLFGSIVYQHYPVKSESVVRAIVQVYMAGAGLEPIAEHSNFRGNSDLEVRVGNRYWVIEFKFCGEGKSVKELLQEALDQLQQKEYGIQIETEELIRVAMVFSEEKRKFVEMGVIQHNGLLC